MESFQKIISSIEPVISLTEKEIMSFSSAFYAKRLKKNEYFLKEGQVCNYVGCINYGVVIYSNILSNGDEVTTDFAFPGDWVTNNKSRLTNQPSLINIRAIEEAEIFVISQQNLAKLYLEMPKTERLGRILMEQAYLRLVEQTMELQIHSAMERYNNLLKNHPEIFQKVPLYHIANYLGIAPKSLSRIRKEH